MQEKLTTLQRYFDNFINQSTDWRFFLGLAEYVDYLETTPETKAVLNEITKSKAKASSQVEILENLVILECIQAMDKLKGIITKNGWEYGGLKNGLKEFISYHEGNIQSSAPLSQNLFFCINDLIVLLVEEGHHNEVKDFYEMFDNDPKKIRRCVFSPGFRELDNAKDFYKHKQNTQIWGAVDQLLLCRVVILEGKDQFNKMTKEKKFPIHALNLSVLLGDMKQIEEGLVKDRYSMFDRSKFGFLGNRVHNYFLSELQKYPKLPLGDITKIEYKNGYVSFDGKKIKISNNENSTQHSIMTSIIESPNKNIDYCDLWPRVFENEAFDKKQWKRLYNPTKRINEKVLIQTQKPDFLIPTKTLVKINPKYIVD